VNHLDTLTLTYTKPSSGPVVADLATPAANQAASGSLGNASITNNTTNIAPSTPALVSPANSAVLNTPTPLLTATFSDPDPNDSGTITFQVCSVSNCSSQLATFSSGAGTANNTNASVSVPAGTIASDGTYYWRAK